MIRKVVSAMSLGAVREDYWQSTARSTIRERCKSIFNQELSSDVKFVVRDSQGGSKGKTIPAHKFVLAISSPVFYAMFYGELAEKKGCIEISDCGYEGLLELFRFIYSDEANLTPDNVMQLMYLAKKYMLPSLADKCSAFLQENLDTSNVFHVLPEAQRYEEKDLLDHCWKVIEEETDKVVKSDGFVTIERSVLEEIVEKDSLNIKEVELLKAVDCWAVQECEKKGLVAEGPVKRGILGERVVKGIRFPTMEQKEFAKVVLDCGILTHKECFDLVKFFNSVLDTPVGFIQSARRAGYAKKAMSRFKSVNAWWDYPPGNLNSLCLSVTKNIKLHAVRLFGSNNNKYTVSLKVRVFNGAYIATETGNFVSKLMHSELGDYQGYDIVFERPVALEANVKYLLNAEITGRPSWYGERGLFRVENSGVVFQFFETRSCSTTVQKGQFAEFLFQLA